MCCCRTETIPGHPSYKATMRLTITNVQASDYGNYKCVAKNPRGDMDGNIKLYSKYFSFRLSLETFKVID